MRILIFTQQFGSFRSGVGTDAFSLAAGLVSRNHTVGVVTPEREELDTQGLKLIAVPNPELDPTPGGWFSLGISFSRVLCANWMEYDIVHFTDAREAWKVTSRNIPVVGRVNDAYAVEWFQKKYPRNFYADRITRSIYYYLSQRIEKSVYRRLTGLIATSRYVANLIAPAYRLNPKKIHVVYNGIPEPSEISPLTVEGFPAVVFVGANFQRKGLPVLLEAVCFLKPRFPKIRIHVIGRDRNQRAIAERARKLGIAENIDFHGWQPNHHVLGMMAGADLFAMPSFTEGFGIVYLEAMKVGTPVVATSVGGATEVFTHDKEVIFVKPGDSQGLAEAIEKIVSDPATAARLRKAGKTAAGRFTMDTNAMKTEEVFFQILEKSQSCNGDLPCSPE